MGETADTTQPRKAKAHPTKAFFVRMLTRDITLEDCILDLIDNSVDAAWSSIKATPTRLVAGAKLANFRVDITISESDFAVVDNCGGITLDDAANYAFTFGRDELGSGPDDYTIGVYGIGMKRAVFKLGGKIRIRSTPRSGDPFVVPINVDAWMADNSNIWDFDIEEDDPLEEPGAEICVEDLEEETTSAFSNPTFINSLRSTIARDYMLSIMQGLTITLNGKSVGGWEVSFKTGRDYDPMRVRYDDDDVSVEIIAGMVAPPPATNEPSERDSDRRSGWYVLCNGRVIVAADRSDVTIWGRDGFPAWHGQYKGFVGVVLFSSRRPDLLPMTTTKRSVDSTSMVYKRALVKMREPTRAWIDYTNARKTMAEEAREKEAKTKQLPIKDVKDRNKVKLPRPLAGKKDANILYAVPVPKVRALGKEFGRSTMPYAEVGRRSFDYAYERLVGEGDRE